MGFWFELCWIGSRLDFHCSSQTGLDSTKIILCVCVFVPFDLGHVICVMWLSPFYLSWSSTASCEISPGSPCKNEELVLCSVQTGCLLPDDHWFILMRLNLSQTETSRWCMHLPVSLRIYCRCRLRSDLVSLRDMLDSSCFFPLHIVFYSLMSRCVTGISADLIPEFSSAKFKVCLSHSNVGKSLR